MTRRYREQPAAFLGLDQLLYCTTPTDPRPGQQDIVNLGFQRREVPAAGHLDSIFEQVVTDGAGQVRWRRALPSLHLTAS